MFDSCISNVVKGELCVRDFVSSCSQKEFEYQFESLITGTRLAAYPCTGIQCTISATEL